MPDDKFITAGIIGIKFVCHNHAALGVPVKCFRGRHGDLNAIHSRFLMMHLA